MVDNRFFFPLFVDNSHFGCIKVSKKALSIDFVDVIDCPFENFNNI